MTRIEDIVNRQVRLWESRGRAASTTAGSRRGVEGRPVVTVSRQAATGGARVARLVADGLGFPVFDKEILSYIARRANVVETILATIDESGRNWLEDSIQTLFNDRIISRSEYMELLTKAVLAIAAQDGAVIVGRGANHILPRERRLAVRLVAPEAWRAARLAEERGELHTEALRRLRAFDESRRRFIEGEFRRGESRGGESGQSVDPPLDYDMVIDVSRFPPEAVAAIIIVAYRAL